MSYAETYYVVDAEDRIVQVEGAFRERLSRFLGCSLWDVSPGAQELFGPHFAEARRTGSDVEFTAFYASEVARRKVTASGSRLSVRVTPLARLDVRTLATLAQSLRDIAAALDAPESVLLAPRAPAFRPAPP